MANKYKPNFNLFSNDDEKSDVDIALEQLLSDCSKENIDSDIIFNVKNIKIEDLEENEYDRFSKDHVQFLKESISIEGLKEPLTVYKKGEKYIILSGHSRFQAIKKIREEDDSQYNSIPCNIVKHEFKNIIDEKKSLAEYNQSREKTNRDKFLEYNSYVDYYAEHKSELQEKNIFERDYISFNMGISKDQVSRYSAIQKKCIEEIKSIFLDGFLTMTITHQICKLPNSKQHEILNKAKEKMQLNNDVEENIGDYIYEELLSQKKANKKEKKNEGKKIIESDSNQVKIENDNDKIEDIIDNTEVPEEYFEEDVEENIENVEANDNILDINDENDKEKLDEELLKNISYEALKDEPEEIYINSSKEVEENKEKHINNNIIFSIDEVKPHIPLEYADNLDTIKDYIFNLIIKAEENI